MKKLFWKLFIIFLSVKWIFKFNLGDIVIYKGKEYVLNQGLQAPYWNMGEKGGGEYLKKIHHSKFKKKLSVKNYFGSFKSGYRFYMTSWFDIWVQEGIKPWMKRCNIWGNR